MKYLKKGGRLALMLLMCIVAGYVLLAGTYLIPTEKLMFGLRETIRVFDESLEDHETMDQTLVEGYPSTWLDNTSDNFFLLSAAYENPEESIWQQAAGNPYYTGHHHSTAGAELVTYVTHGPEGRGVALQGRYWNGYLLFLKPLLTVMSYQDIRMINMVAQGVMLVALLCLLYRRGLQRYIPAFGAAYLCLTPFVIPLNMHYSVVIYIMLAAMLAMLLWPRWVHEKLGSTAFFMLLGAATVYFDMLTYPLLAFAFPAILWLFLCDEEGEARSLITLIRIGLAWLAGYAVMWAGKWVIMALTGYAEETKWALESIFIRSDSSELGRFSAIGRNLQVLMRKPFKLLALGAAAVAAVVFIRGMLSKESRFVPASPMLWLSLLGLAVLPFAWYAAMVNSNHVHYFFMHRSLSITVFAGLCLLTRVLKRTDGRSWFVLPPTELK